MKQLLLLIPLCLPFVLSAQKETSLPSKIDKVTVFFQGAQLSRSLKTTLKPGRQLVVFEKLTDFIDPNSVQIKALGDLTILSVGTRKNFDDIKMSNAKISELRSKKKVLEDEEQVLTNEYELLVYDKTLLLYNRELKGDNGLSVSELKEAYTFMHDELKKITTRHSKIQDRMEEIVKAINHIDQEMISQRSKPVLNYSEIIVEIDVNSATSAEFFANYMSPNASWKPYYDMRSKGIGSPVKLEAKAFVHQTTGIEWTNVDLVLSTNDPYQNTEEPELTPWNIYYNNRPAQRQHKARTVPTFSLSGQKIRGEVIDAETGEPLPFAKVTFNNNPAVGAITDSDGKFEIVAPQGGTYITANFIGYDAHQQLLTSSYMKFFLSPQTVVVFQDAHPAGATITREDIARMPARMNASVATINGVSVRGARSQRRKLFGKKVNSVGSTSNVSGSYSMVAQATVVQRDLRVEYTIKDKFTIPSNGVDQRVQISMHELPANYEYHAAPKIDQSVYLVAEVSGWEKLNLLDGESNLYFDGTYIGKTHVDANSMRDTLTFSLGKDSKIQIERKRIDKNSSTRAFGLRRKFEVEWQLDIRNNGGANIPIVIKDQFPISADEDIKIKLGDYEGAQLDEKTRILTWEFKLATGEKKAYRFNYRVDYKKSNVLYIE
ncbi:MAG: hypothetical protein ACI865_000710 [Flavobacteriaceae bacterium]|jgi:hypothetical protein